MKLKSPAVPAVLLTGALLTGCSSAAEAQHNTVLTQAAHTLQYPKLSKEAVRSSVEFTTEQTVNTILDLTGTETPQKVVEFKQMLAAAARIIAASQPTPVTVTNPSGVKNSVIELAVPLPRTKRTYIFVTPQQLEQDSHDQLPDSATFTQPTVGQTISLISVDPKPDERLEAIPYTTLATATEICQSEVAIDTKTPVDSDTADVLQEAFCNGLGRAIAAHESGVSYADYVTAFADHQVNANNYIATMYLASSVTYAALVN